MEPCLYIPKPKYYLITDKDVKLAIGRVKNTTKKGDEIVAVDIGGEMTKTMKKLEAEKHFSKEKAAAVAYVIDKRKKEIEDEKLLRESKGFVNIKIGTVSEETKNLKALECPKCHAPIQKEGECEWCGFIIILDAKKEDSGEFPERFKNAEVRTRRFKM